MSEERDTHFAGFAKLVAQEILDEMRERRTINDEDAMEMIIAQRAYDLFVHDRMNTGTSDLQHAASDLEAQEMVHGIPDLTQWPDSYTNE